MQLVLELVESKSEKIHLVKFQKSPLEGKWIAECATFCGGLRFILAEVRAPAALASCGTQFELSLEGDSLPEEFPFSTVRLKGFSLHAATSAAVANGYQCWSESPLLGCSDLLQKEKFADRTMFGDAEFYCYAEKPGVFHSWLFSWSVIDGAQGNGFFGSLDEDLCYSLFEFDLPARRFAIVLDVAGLHSSSLTVKSVSGGLRLGAWLFPRADARMFPPLHESAKVWADAVQSYERVSRTWDASRGEPVRGYTSWYYHYTKISEDLLIEQLNASRKMNWKVFQVDDGYQNRIGDWLTPSAGFPNGVKVVAEAACKAGMIPGIWCAPFIVMENSDLAKDHPDWILRDPAGMPVLCGVHPLWGGNFFALDSENAGVRSYVSNVLETYFSVWGFRMLKADFLYATARVPGGGLTRAQRAARAHQFLYDLCTRHQAHLLSCGATLSSALRRCDYSRVGADVGLTWENDEIGSDPSREKVSTRGTLTNTLTRACLGGVVFGNDPDVIILRDEAQSMPRSERELLAEINARLGQLVFCSDDVSRYDDWQHAVWKGLDQTFSTAQDRVVQIEFVPACGTGSFVVHFESGVQWLVNLTDHAIGSLAARTFEKR